MAAVASDKYEAEIGLDIVGSWLATPVNLSEDMRLSTAVINADPRGYDHPPQHEETLRSREVPPRKGDMGRRWFT